LTREPQVRDLETRRWGDVHAGGDSCARAGEGEGVTLEQLRHCLSVLISAREDVDGSPEGSFCVVVCRTEIGCGSSA
jgi:hypothetical protein